MSGWGFRRSRATDGEWDGALVVDDRLRDPNVVGMSRGASEREADELARRWCGDTRGWWWSSGNCRRAQATRRRAAAWPASALRWRPVSTCPSCDIMQCLFSWVPRQVLMFPGWNAFSARAGGRRWRAQGREPSRLLSLSPQAFPASLDHHSPIVLPHPLRTLDPLCPEAEVSSVALPSALASPASTCLLTVLSVLPASSDSPVAGLPRRLRVPRSRLV